MKIFLLVLTTIIWGTTFFVIKDTVNTVNEYYIVFIRTFIAAVLMLVFIYFKDKRSLLNRKTIIRGAVLGVLLGVVYISQTIGLKYTSSGHSAFITGTGVIFIPVLLFFMYKRRFKLGEIIALVVIISGLYLLTYDSGTAINIGDLITLITAISLAWHLVLAGKYVQTSEVLSLVAYQFLFASLVSLALYFTEQEITFGLTMDESWALLYLGFAGTLFCYFVSVWAQKDIDTLTVALIFTLEPVFAALFAWLFASEILNPRELIGAFVILLGIVSFQVFSNRKARIDRAKSQLINLKMD